MCGVTETQMPSRRQGTVWCTGVRRRIISAGTACSVLRAVHYVLFPRRGLTCRGWSFRRHSATFCAFPCRCAQLSNALCAGKLCRAIVQSNCAGLCAPLRDALCAALTRAYATSLYRPATPQNCRFRTLRLRVAPCAVRSAQCALRFALRPTLLLAPPTSFAYPILPSQYSVLPDTYIYIRPRVVHLFPSSVIP